MRQPTTQLPRVPGTPVMGLLPFIGYAELVDEPGKVVVRLVHATDALEAERELWRVLAKSKHAHREFRVAVVPEDELPFRGFPAPRPLL